ncbi:hypothetical protein KR038_006556, partial [Drosophila bunnanda]
TSTRNLYGPFSSYGLISLGLLLAIICLFKPRLGRFIMLQVGRIYKFYAEYSPIEYLSDDCLTPVSRRCLQLVAKKTLVLDMDETLITAWIQPQDDRRQSPPCVPHDFKFVLCEPKYKGDVYVYKRPHVDRFLNCVSRWYDLVIFTCGTKHYAEPILDFLDNGRGILTKRFYRHHTVDVGGLMAKYITLCSPDLANILLLDNSRIECCFNVGNCIPISSYKIGEKDEALLDLLPFLDALRFTRDVRSVLGKCTRFVCLST